MTLDAIDKNEALRYLGCKENIDNERMISLLDECEKRLISAAAPKYLYEVFPIAFELGGVRISDSNIILRGNDAAEHLKNCNRIVLMCATLGQAEDRCHRAGTTQTVNIYSILTRDSVDVKVHDIIIPITNNFIEKMDFENNIIYVKNMGDLNEN